MANNGGKPGRVQSPLRFRSWRWCKRLFYDRNILDILIQVADHHRDPA